MNQKQIEPIYLITLSTIEKIDNKDTAKGFYTAEYKILYDSQDKTPVIISKGISKGMPQRFLTGCPDLAYFISKEQVKDLEKSQQITMLDPNISKHIESLLQIDPDEGFQPEFDPQDMSFPYISSFSYQNLNEDAITLKVVTEKLDSILAERKTCF